MNLQKLIYSHYEISELCLDNQKEFQLSLIYYGILLLEYSKKFLIDYKIPSIPAKFVNDTKETKNSNDLFRQIIEDDYEEGDEDDYVSIYDIMIKSKIRDDKNGKKKIISKMKQLPYKTTYNKDKQVNKKKGVFYGIREILDED